MANPNASAAHLPKWPPGQSGNPAGRPAAGLSVAEWWNQLHMKTEDELIAVRDDKSLPKLKRRAAAEILSDEGSSLDRIMDRTVGKPSQAVAIEHSGTVHVAKVILEDAEPDDAQA